MASNTNGQVEMSGLQREAVKNELRAMETDPARRKERNTLHQYYLELCLRTNLPPA